MGTCVILSVPSKGDQAFQGRQKPTLLSQHLPYSRTTLAETQKEDHAPRPPSYSRGTGCWSQPTWMSLLVEKGGRVKVVGTPSSHFLLGPAG